MITQDKAHATGRVVTRPRVADQASHEDWLVVESYLKMIDYSPVFSEWFQDTTEIQVKIVTIEITKAIIVALAIIVILSITVITAYIAILLLIVILATRNVVLIIVITTITPIIIV